MLMRMERWREFREEAGGPKCAERPGAVFGNWVITQGEQESTLQ